ncbi:GNAT family N-acetyltransferase [Paenibacillus sp. MSJ-34]|uniref:GNAT family N-acetyltransferase n=1 Tax=Paenibacillus sp. MSJ-34 TaxID=2841529 RepID=UPI00346153E0
MVSISKEHNNGELGFFVRHEYWNMGFSTEACQALIEFGFNDLGPLSGFESVKLFEKRAVGCHTNRLHRIGRIHYHPQQRPCRPM